MLLAHTAAAADTSRAMSDDGSSAPPAATEAPPPSGGPSEGPPDAAAASGKKGKKRNNRKRNKKKAAPPTETVELGALLSMEWTPAQGRHAVATRDVAAGELLFTEQAFTYAVKPSPDVVCSVCLSELPEGRPPAHSCVKCVAVVYCSDECRDMHSELHALACPALVAARAVPHADMDPTLLALMVWTDARRVLEATGGTVPDMAPRCAPELREAMLPCGKVAAVQALEAHESSTDAKWLESVRRAAEAVVPALAAGVPADSDVPPATADDLVGIALRVNNNAYSCHGRAGLTSLAVGLWPALSILNHSCYPNASYYGGGNGVVAVRAMRDIPKGTQVCTTYIELYAPRELRQQALLNTKHFSCHCERCDGRQADDKPLLGMVCDDDGTLLVQGALKKKKNKKKKKKKAGAETGDGAGAGADAGAGAGAGASAGAGAGAGAAASTDAVPAEAESAAPEAAADVDATKDTACAADPDVTMRWICPHCKKEFHDAAVQAQQSRATVCPLPLWLMTCLCTNRC